MNLYLEIGALYDSEIRVSGTHSLSLFGIENNNEWFAALCTLHSVEVVVFMLELLEIVMRNGNANENEEQKQCRIGRFVYGWMFVCLCGAHGKITSSEAI